MARLLWNGQTDDVLQSPILFFFLAFVIFMRISYLLCVWVCVRVVFMGERQADRVVNTLWNNNSNTIKKRVQYWNNTKHTHTHTVASSCLGLHLLLFNFLAGFVLFVLLSSIFAISRSAEFYDRCIPSFDSQSKNVFISRIFCCCAKSFITSSSVFVVPHYCLLIKYLKYMHNNPKSTTCFFHQQKHIRN